MKAVPHLRKENNHTTHCPSYALLTFLQFVQLRLQLLHF
jgi:hypothetical protein